MKFLDKCDAFLDQHVTFAAIFIPTVTVGIVCIVGVVIMKAIGVLK